MAILWSVSASDNQFYTEADVWPFCGQYQPQINSCIQAGVWPFCGLYQPQITSFIQRLMCGHFMVSISLR